ncbi:PhzF family phenazine biosynthesis protein [Dongia sp.]|uniref:PhzF family phenazine biosynthesis protein n=1 Tax=Dongia sp. TaxID=1977262 RepID=UPI0035AEA179
MKHPIYQVDAFTDRAFAGNPAGVMPLNVWLPDQTLQAIAAEMNLAETAFFVPTGAGQYHLRWFTPTVEVKLCGHATLASAFVLTRFIDKSLTEMRFDSLSGQLFVRVDGDRLELDFPLLSFEANSDATLPGRIAAAIGQQPVDVVASPVYDAYLARLSDGAAVRAAVPNFPAIEALGCDLIITADGAGEGVDFVSRFFAPLHGIPEDPVTGSSHCVLAPYWQQQSGRAQFHARQVSKRGGDLWLTMKGDRLRIAGHAVCVLQGEIEVN